MKTSTNDRRFRCSGRSSATEVACDFATDDEAEAEQHFEIFDHDVDDTFRAISER